MLLRPYQDALKNAIYRLWWPDGQRPATGQSWTGVRNAGGVLGTGGGKTVIFSSILADEPGASVVIAHRKELVSQTSLALVRNKIRHRIIGQKDLIQWCCRQSVNVSGHNYIDSRARCAAAGVDTLVRMDTSDPWFNSVRLWVVDECFPAGTLVDGRPIESIQVGDTVTAFDEKTGTFHKRPVLQVFKNARPSWLVEIEYPGGRIECTYGHPFWTLRGWVPAGKLTLSDTIFTQRRRLPITRLEAFSYGGGDGLVYNIEVEEFHTYLANGVVVHNCHHLQADNKWGTATKMFPNARGLGVSATPERADGSGLGRPDGLIDALVAGPTMRELINQGFLCDFRVYDPPSDIDLSHVPTSPGGDYSPEPLRAAVHKSHIVGDVVQHYLRFAPGQLGVTFCVDVESAVETCAAFRSAGVPAEVVTGGTRTEIRSNLMRRFERADFKQLCVVDIVSEGTDIPAIEVVSFARPSQSYTLVAQQAGRALRPFGARGGTEIATIIDHVGNIRRFARVAMDPFDGKTKIELDRLSWSLSRRERRSRSTQPDVEVVRVCSQCLATFPAIQGRTCPLCGHHKPVGERSTPEQVDGNLLEMSPESLLGLKRSIQRIDEAALYPANATPEIRGAIAKRHRERQEAQSSLRAAMAQWGGIQSAQGFDPAQQQQLFYYTFGVDVATAQALGRPEAAALEIRVLGAITHRPDSF